MGDDPDGERTVRDCRQRCRPAHLKVRPRYSVAHSEAFVLSLGDSLSIEGLLRKLREKRLVLSLVSLSLICSMPVLQLQRRPQANYES
ncbi:hypothetical protein IEQ34_012511 [Dendrobium chrysotoxum]|uniref:Uncharacterized protein n=1 Tax=Dendrobium chrysotoxum TaxID=161865 RepID=A0AAV7GUM0_DENCH|nr:hypothetical protein IEQ34_012511 [Dendrobium chrysotoxum]